MNELESTLNEVEIDQADDLPALLARRERARPNRVTYALMAALLIVVGFLGGAYVAQRTGLGDGDAATPFAGMPDLSTLPGAGAGFAPGAGSAGAAVGTTGTVTLVDQENLYLTATDGTVVKVRVAADVPVTAQADITLSDLKPGDSVTVQGEADAEGVIDATSVSEGAPSGVPSGNQEQGAPQ